MESTTYLKIIVLTLLLLEKSNIPGNFNYIMSLQDHNIQIYPNSKRKTKFNKVPKHLIICYRPPMNGKSIRQLEIKL